MATFHKMTDASGKKVIRCFVPSTRPSNCGRGLYDNLARYIRFQIGGLFGYIITLPRRQPSSTSPEGIPLLPLQTLWVSFTMLSIQSVGLGYSKPAAGLMDRPPLPPGRPILTRGLIAWLAFTGLLMAVGTLAVISWADQAHGLAIARTMGMVTFALFLLFFSIESKDERDSALSLDTFSGKTFIITTSGSFVLLILSTVLSIFQTVLKTVTLDVVQWLICTAVALSGVVAAGSAKRPCGGGRPRRLSSPPAPARPEPPPSNAHRVPDLAMAGLQAPAWAWTRPEATASASAAWSRSV